MYQREKINAPEDVSFICGAKNKHVDCVLPREFDESFRDVCFVQHNLVALYLEKKQETRINRFCFCSVCTLEMWRRTSFRVQRTRRGRKSSFNCGSSSISSPPSEAWLGPAPNQFNECCLDSYKRLKYRPANYIRMNILFPHFRLSLCNCDWLDTPYGNMSGPMNFYTRERERWRTWGGQRGSGLFEPDVDQNNGLAFDKDIVGSPFEGDLAASVLVDGHSD